MNQISRAIRALDKIERVGNMLPNRAMFILWDKLGLGLPFIGQSFQVLGKSKFTGYWFNSLFSLAL